MNDCGTRSIRLSDRDCGAAGSRSRGCAVGKPILQEFWGGITAASLTFSAVKPPNPPRNAPYGLKVATAAVQLALPLRFTFAEYGPLLVTMPDSLAARDEPVSC